MNFWTSLIPPLTFEWPPRIFCHFITYRRACCWRDHSQCCLCLHLIFICHRVRKASSSTSPHYGNCHTGNCQCFPRWHNFPVYFTYGNIFNKCLPCEPVVLLTFFFFFFYFLFFYSLFFIYLSIFFNCCSDHHPILLKFCQLVLQVQVFLKELLQLLWSVKINSNSDNKLSH